MIKIDNLIKKYGKNTVIEIEKLTIEDNQVVGLVGNNGAGKTTLMNLIAGYIKPSSGVCLIDEKVSYVNFQCTDKIALIDEKMHYCGNTKLEEILKEMKILVDGFNHDKAINNLKYFDIDAGKKYNNLSKGMKNIFNLVLGFSLPHKIILFDEITSGLDEFARLKFAEILSLEVVENPKIYILSTHLFGEISNIAEKVIVLRKGKVKLFEDVDSLSSKLVTLRGKVEDIEKFLKGRTIYLNKNVGCYRETVIYNNLNRHDKIYLEEQGVEIDAVPISQICAIIAANDNDSRGEV